MVRGEFDGSLQGVDEPPQDNLPSTPACITFVQLLGRDRFASYRGIVLPIIGTEDTIIDVEQLAAELVEGMGRTLGNEDLIVDVNVGIAESGHPSL